MCVHTNFDIIDHTYINISFFFLFIDRRDGKVIINSQHKVEVPKFESQL